MKKKFQKQDKKKLLQQSLLFVIFLLFGIIIMNHVESVRSETKRQDLIFQYREFEKQLQDQQDKYARLEQENKELNERKAAVIEALLIDQGYDTLSNELQYVRVLAGFTEVNGPGIIVTLNDKPGYDILKDSDASIVHDGDIRHVIDLLRNAGAAAISVNDLRITHVSSVICIGSTIRCNQSRMLPPFVIKAIGDPVALQSVIDGDEMLNLRKSTGIGLIVSSETSETVTVPPFMEADQFQRYITLLEGNTP